ncbi:MAG: hypothetical protein LW875_04995 [Proteobacteria bacterium]|nr:hypothetical protein [Pseudomonadota bacterium]
MFNFILGVDQTGAQTSQGFAKPLPVAVIYKNSARGWKLSVSQSKKSQKLAGLTRDSVLKLLHTMDLPGRDLTQVLIIVDSVLGLPKKVWDQQSFTSISAPENLFQLFRKASEFSLKDNSYGLETSKAFFEGLRKGLVKEPRVAEKLAGANSLFNFTPYQKNIATGTFRIWKDLGSSEEPWFQIAGFDSVQSHVQAGAWISEGYPSFVWKSLLGEKTRNPAKLADLLERDYRDRLQFSQADLQLISKDSDLADSVVLALQGFILNEKSGVLDEFTRYKLQSLEGEGWILGLPLTPAKTAVKSSLYADQFARHPC